MVKVTKAFELLHPIDKKVAALPDQWDSLMLHMRGRAALICTAPHPIISGWYRLQLTNGKMQIEVSFSSILNIGTEQELLPHFQEIPEMMAAFTEIVQTHMRAKFLTF